MGRMLLVLLLLCFLLVSAIVQNPDRLAEWLHEATGGESLPVPLDWRPTRSLRCAVGVDIEAVRAEAHLAMEHLEAKSDHFKNERFEANFALLVGLQGAWQVDNELDYAIARLPVKALLRVHRSRTDSVWSYEIQASWQGNSWVNESSRF